MQVGPEGLGQVPSFSPVESKRQSQEQPVRSFPLTSTLGSLPSLSPQRPIPFGDSKEQFVAMTGLKNEIGNLKSVGDVSTHSEKLLAARANKEISEGQFKALAHLLSAKQGQLQKAEDQLVAGVIAGTDGKTKESKATVSSATSAPQIHRPTLQRRGARTDVMDVTTAKIRTQSRANESGVTADARGPRGLSALTGQPLNSASLVLANVGRPVEQRSTEEASKEEKAENKTKASFFTKLFGAKSEKLSTTQATAESASLKTFLQEKPAIPAAVRDLANSGVQHVKKNGMQAVAQEVEPGPMGQPVLKAADQNSDNPAIEYSQQTGSRFSGWVEKMFGKSEKEIRSDFVDKMTRGEMPPPKPVSVKTTQEAFNSLPPGAHNLQDQIQYQKGFSAEKWAEKGNSGRNIMQVASQFNYQEALDANRKADIDGKPGVTIDACCKDKTQGGRAVTGAAAAGLHRKAACDAGKLPDALTNCLSEKSRARFFKNGYLHIDKNATKEEIKALRKDIEKNISKLETLPQQVIGEESGGQIMQVFNAAPDISNAPGALKEEADAICSMLVVAQYRALAQMAAIRSEDGTNEPVELHLTLVGQGVFGNDSKIMGEALKAVHETIQGRNVKVVYQCFSDTDYQKLVSGAQKAGCADLIPKTEIK